MSRSVISEEIALRVALVKADIHPLKDPRGGSARERVVSLRRILADKAPPWLAKAMGRPPWERVRFASGETEA